MAQLEWPLSLSCFSMTSVARSRGFSSKRAALCFRIVVARICAQQEGSKILRNLVSLLFIECRVRRSTGPASTISFTYATTAQACVKTGASDPTDDIRKSDAFRKPIHSRTILARSLLSLWLFEGEGNSPKTQHEGFKQTDSFVLFSKASSNVKFNQKEGKATKK